MAKAKNEKAVKNVEELKYKDDETRDIVVRLRRIEGQVKGIEKMVSSEACCRNILVQVAAVRAAVNKVGGLILERYAKNCLVAEGEDINDESLEELISTFLMFLK